MSAPPKVPAAKKRTSSVGCLGCFSTICMTAMTALSVFAIRWIDPNWLDDHAFWKGEKLQPETVFVLQPGPGDTPPPATPVVRAFEERPIAVPHVGATASYEPSKPSVLSLPDGGRMEIPAGAIPAAFDVTLAPVLRVPDAMAAPFCGGVYEFTAGSLEHMTFRKPVKVTVPYDPALVTSGPTLAVFVDGKGWQKLPTTVDTQAKVLRAEMQHASILGAIGVALGGGYALFGTEKGGRVWTGIRTGWENVTHPFAKTYKTNSFAIHYYVKGRDAVPEDDTYLDRNARRPADVPLYILDLGQYLEEALARLDAIGVDVPKAKHVRWDVFVGQAGAGVYGYTPYGGPVFMSNRLDGFAAIDGLTAEIAMRNTAAHELAHLAQPAIVGSAVASNTAKPFLEGTAAYLGEAAWLGTPHEHSMLGISFLKSTDSASFPQKTWAGSDGPLYYEWGNMFRAIDRVRGKGKGLAAVLHMMDSKQLSYEGLEAAMAAQGGSGSDAVEALARVFYHDDLWTADFSPHHHRGFSGDAFKYHRYGGARETFVHVALSSVAGGKQVINPGATAYWVSAESGTAFANYAWVSPLPKFRKAKLAMVIEPAGKSLNKFLVAADKVPAATGKYGMPDLPLSGSPAGFTEHYASDGTWKHVYEEVGRDGPNLFTVLTVNQSTKVSSPGWFVHRWLLLAPDKVTAKRQPDGKYKVTWERNPLRDATDGRLTDGSPYFKEYRLYRKQSSEPVENFELVRSALDVEEYEDTPPYEGSWVYSVKVVDALGNTSEYGRWNEDPFSGKWEGEFRLVTGSLVGPLNAYFEKEMRLSEAKRRAEIAQIENAQDRAEAQKELEENLKLRDEYWPKIKDLLEGFEELCRIGAPITLEVAPDGGNRTGEYYRVKMTHFAFAPLEDPSGPPMKGFVFKRGPQDTIEMVVDFGAPTDAEDAEAIAYLKTAFPPVKLTLCHVDEEKGFYEIRERSYTMKPEIDGKVETATITWSFEKHSEREE